MVTKERRSIYTGFRFLSFRRLSSLFWNYFSFNVLLKLGVHISLKLSSFINWKFINIEFKLLRGNVALVYYLPNSFKRVARESTNILTECFFISYTHRSELLLNRFLLFCVDIKNLSLSYSFVRWFS